MLLLLLGTHNNVTNLLPPTHPVPHTNVTNLPLPTPYQCHKPPPTHPIPMSQTSPPPLPPPPRSRVPEYQCHKLPIRPSVCLSVCLSACLSQSFSLTLCLSVCLSLSFSLPLYPEVNLCGLVQPSQCPLTDCSDGHSNFCVLPVSWWSR